MKSAKFSKETRSNKVQQLDSDLVVVGGGMAGICTAIAAARAGIKVVLVQDRPVLGGNASSEVRLWILGATSHMGNNNRWSREGGVIDEILLENLSRNKEGNTLIFDTILLEKVVEEDNITLLLNTAVYEVSKRDERNIEELTAFCSQNSMAYKLRAPLFCDASGDGVVSYLSGAAFRMGAESKEEFGELFAPDHNYGELLGHTLYFYSKKAEQPVKYVPPAFALKDIKQIPRYKNLTEEDYGCRLWWMEFGGRKDTVHETEDIKWELWKVVYGVWDHIKNSGEFKDTENLTLEWVGTIPGKRESRRFEGLYMMKQQDVVEQRNHDDAVAFGGWAIDLHPADGIYSDLPGCNQWHAKGIYQIPLRSYISRDIDNLMYAGRIISSTHVAFGSTRVMATCAHGGQAVGEAAAICQEKGLIPKQLLESETMRELQNRLNVNGQFIPGIPIDKSEDLTSTAKIITSSNLVLEEIPFDGDWLQLNNDSAQMLPLSKGQKYSIEIEVEAAEETTLTCELRRSLEKANFTPEVKMQAKEIPLEVGIQKVQIDFTQVFEDDQYGYITFLENKAVKLRLSNKRYSGVLSVFKKVNKAVSNYGEQNPPDNIGVDAFEFWTPERRPAGQNIAMNISPSLNAFEGENILNGYTRPYIRTNAWAASIDEKEARVEFRWEEPQKINKVKVYLDGDFDHPLESSLMGHPEEAVPFCVQNFSIKNCHEETLAVVKDNCLSTREIVFDEPVETAGLKIDMEQPGENVPIALFEVSIT